MPVRISSADIVLVLRYAGAPLTGVFQMTAFDQSDTMDMIVGAMVPVTADHMLTTPLDQTGLNSRFSVARPGVTGMTGYWNIVAMPGASVNATGGIVLQQAGVAATDTMVTTSFGNPFESLGWPAVFQASFAQHRTYTFMGLPVTLTAAVGLQADTATTPSIDFAAPMPEQVNLESNQLTTDGTTVMIDPTTTHTIDFQTENKPAALYTLNLLDLTIDAGAPKETLVFAGIAVQPKFTIPGGVMQATHTYIPRVGTIAGDYPNAATGDIRTRAIPASNTYFDAGVFTVVAP
jgi:hypothetical protein